MTQHKLSQPVLETARLTLRPLRKADAGLASLYTSDWRVARMTSSIPHPNPPGAVEAFIESVNGPNSREMSWAIDATKGFGTEIVGVIALRPDGEIGYWIAPFFWGLGIASEALDQVLNFGWNSGRTGFCACAFADNPGSQRVLEKAGFVRCGEKDQFSVARNVSVPSLVYRLERGDGE